MKNPIKKIIQSEAVLIRSLFCENFIISFLFGHCQWNLYNERVEHINRTIHGTIHIKEMIV